MPDLDLGWAVFMFFTLLTFVEVGVIFKKIGGVHIPYRVTLMGQ